MKSWERQKKFKKVNVVSITPEEMFMIVQSIKDRTLQALVALLYITGCRISELIRYERLQFDTVEYIDDKGKKRKKILWKTKKIIESLPSIKKGQLEYKETNNEMYLISTVRNLKNRISHVKIIPFSCNRPINKKFLDIINNFIEGKTNDTELFPYRRSEIEYSLRKILPFNIHFIRDIRATHLYVTYDMKEEELKRVMGWTDTRPAGRYVDLKWHDYASKT